MGKKIIGYILLFIGLLSMPLFIMVIAFDLFDNGYNPQVLLPYLSTILISLFFIGLGTFLIRKSKTTILKISIGDNLFFERKVEIEIELTFREYLSGLILKSPIFGFSPIIVLSIIIIQFISAISSNEVEILQRDIFVSLISFLLVSTFACTVFFYLMKKQFRRVAKKKLIYSFYEDVAIVKNAVSESKIQLNQIKRIKLSKKIILIFFVTNSVNIIPKNRFKSKDELSYFLSVFKQH